ncbi:hypothetical protein PR370_01080 [Mycobacterium marinum]|uniref:hypothetical protein n=1 Tax=Mycobacterium marinum TaxID=1781 RepID=UPI002358E80E|nr:hypothetical protein [Mycobacterium marinum]MDC8980673.1 hypothetical protein [Mycobacterium marinum]MDC8997901.1 hypothetical protein [Mycobacterium marinum]MDC9008641.1 hypothetical protein [Mycobacterium marinum]
MRSKTEDQPVPYEVIDYVVRLDDGRYQRKSTGAFMRLVIDADCPGCGWPERWCDGQQFGCAKCEYHSSERDQ